MNGPVTPPHLNRRALTIGVFTLPLVGCNPPGSGTPKTKRPRATATAQPARPGDLTELTALDPSIRLDIRYATTNNFTGRQLYTQARAFMVRPAAEALARAHRAALKQGFGLTIHDAYRPWRVTKALWDATPPGPKRNFVANPKKGSKHNRGCAVDLTLHELKSGQLVAMPSAYDEFSPRADRSFMDAPADAIAHRALLERLMEAEGFVGISNEWWHFDFNGWEGYPILDVPFEELG